MRLHQELAKDKMVFALHLARIATQNSMIGKNVVELSTDDITCMIDGAFGLNFPWHGKGLNNPRDVTFEDINLMVPLLLCSAPGHDVSGRVEAMARSESKELLSVAMGSSEGYRTAESFIATASKRGVWVTLKNVHLCTEWLEDTLVKILQSMNVGTHCVCLFITQCCCVQQNCCITIDKSPCWLY